MHRFVGSSRLLHSRRLRLVTDAEAAVQLFPNTLDFAHSRHLMRSQQEHDGTRPRRAQGRERAGIYNVDVRSWTA